MLGAAFPHARAFDYDLAGDWWLVVYTDGVSSRFELNDLPVFRAGEPQALADAVLAGWGRQTDDATVVVVRPRLAG